MNLSNEIISCNFCGSSSSTLYDQIQEWKIVKCNNCGFHYTNPRPTLESLPYYYSEEYFKDERHRAKFYNEDGSLKADVANYTNRIMDAESHVNKRGSILEVGAARGGYLHVMKQRGWEVAGVEISQDACNQAKLMYGLDLFCGVMVQYQAQQKYDVVSMYQTLEHVPDPKEVIQKSYELLKPGGNIVIEVPNRNCFEMKYSAERRRLSYDLPRHLNHFTPDFLAKELEKANFEVIDIRRNEDKMISRILEKRQSAPAANAPKQAASGSSTAAPAKEIPLLRYPSGFKQQILQTINKVLPGWRFTIIGRKK